MELQCCRKPPSDVEKGWWKYCWRQFRKILKFQSDDLKQGKTKGETKGEMLHFVSGLSALRVQMLARPNDSDTVSLFYIHGRLVQMSSPLPEA